MALFSMVDNEIRIVTDRHDFVIGKTLEAANFHYDSKVWAWRKPVNSKQELKQELENLLKIRILDETDPPVRRVLRMFELKTLSRLPEPEDRVKVDLLYIVGNEIRVRAFGNHNDKNTSMFLSEELKAEGFRFDLDLWCWRKALMPPLIGKPGLEKAIKIAQKFSLLIDQPVYQALFTCELTEQDAAHRRKQVEENIRPIRDLAKSLVIDGCVYTIYAIIVGSIIWYFVSRDFSKTLWFVFLGLLSVFLFVLIAGRIVAGFIFGIFYKRIGEQLRSRIQKQRLDELPKLISEIEERISKTKEEINRIYHQVSSRQQEIENLKSKTATWPFSEDLEKISALRGIEFEDFLERLYKSRGYKVQRTPVSDDKGADLILQENAIKIAVQAKGRGSTRSGWSRCD